MALGAGALVSKSSGLEVGNWRTSAVDFIHGLMHTLDLGGDPSGIIKATKPWQSGKAHGVPVDLSCFSESTGEGRSRLSPAVVGAGGRPYATTPWR